MKKMSPPTTCGMKYQSQKLPAWPSTMSTRFMRAGHQHDPHHREAHGQLVGDHLGAGPQAAEQREVAVGRPAGQHHAVDRDGAHGQEQHQAGVEVGDHVVEAVAEEVRLAPHRPEGQHRHHQEGGDEDDVGRQPEDRLVGAGGDQVLLGEQLEDVAEGLERAPRAQVGGPDPPLEEAGELALEEDDEGHHRDDEHRHEDGLDDEEYELGYRVAHRSQSPSTTSMLAKMATMSAIISPSTRGGTACPW